MTHCFLSHLHYDHFMDYPRLLMTRWDQSAGKLAPLEVFGPSPISRITNQLIGADGFGLDASDAVRAVRECLGLPAAQS